MIDIGATYQKTYSTEFLQGIVEVHRISFTLPNNTRAVVTHRGMTKIADGIVLKDILVVPTFNFNLMSVSRLLKDTNLKLIFKKGGCRIMDYSQNKVVGIAKDSEGLYSFNEEPPVRQ